MIRLLGWGATEEVGTACPLDWFPLEFGVGGLDASGSQRLLGQPKMEILELLLREAAQNSWDARIPGHRPVFGATCRVLDKAARHALAEKVFAHQGEATRIPHSLQRGNLAVLEIFDRGTVGLNGPVRADRSVPPGTPTNLIDLVFNVGTANKTEATGGTFGFGKSSAFKMSRCNTVVYWSVCLNEQGDREHRLIVSALGEAFDKWGKRFTGRHWWGRQADDGNRVEPLVGDEAAELGEELFKRKFESGETGTSLLILDPDPSALVYFEDLAHEDVNTALLPGIHSRMEQMMVKNLWPKIAGSGAPGSRSMDLEVDSKLLTSEILDSYPVLDGYRSALGAIRRIQDQGDSTPVPLTEVVEIRSQRPKMLLGHLGFALKMSSEEAESATGKGKPTIPSEHVCFMRNQAELVVKYHEGSLLGLENVYWTAVFRPVKELDHAFASAETPAHDDWVPQSMAKSPDKTSVNVALREIKQAVRDFIASHQPKPDSAAAGSAAGLATELSDLSGATMLAEGAHGAGGITGGPVDSDTTAGARPKGGGNAGGETLKGSGKGRGKAMARPGARVVSIRLVDVQPEGMRRHRLTVELTGSWSSGDRLKLVASIATDDGNLALGPEERLGAHWGSDFEAGRHDSMEASFRGNPGNQEKLQSVDIVLPAGLAFRIDAQVDVA